ncbi:hypothetical protein [Polymorphospora rubra]|uniref:hypothetical protein n=1 Tax=Polymorphospora rubra TaxID=338584 RepID=UPI00340A2CD8
MLVLGIALLAGGLWTLVALRRGRWPFDVGAAPPRRPAHRTPEFHHHPGTPGIPDGEPVRAAVRPPEAAIYVPPPRGTVYGSGGSGTPPYGSP